MDLNEALSEHSLYAVKFGQFTFHFTLRNPNNKEDLEYRRRSNKMQVKNKTLESSEQSLDAPLWLLDQLIIKRQYSNGSEAPVQDISDDQYAKIPPRLKLRVITEHLNYLEGEEASDLKKS